MEQSFSIKDGVLTKYMGSEAVVSIPEGVIEIGEKVFAESETLTKVIMPDSVTAIDANAFAKCGKLKSVVFSQQLTTIGVRAFLCCKALKEVSLPKTLRSIGAGAFAGCVKLAKATCESDVLELYENPFSAYSERDCELLFDKDGFLVFDHTLCQYRENAEVVTVPEGVTRIVEYVFYRQFYQTSSNIKQIVLPESVRYIGDRCFQSCAKLSKINLPSGVELGSCVFEGCKKLADENGFIIVGNEAHAYFGKQTEIELPEGIESLEDDLFKNGYGCNPANGKITRVVLPKSLKRIGKSVFENCGALKEINIPAGIEEIGEGAFRGCTSLPRMEIPSTAKLNDLVFYGCDAWEDENGFIIVNGYLYQYYGLDREVVVPENVKYIGTHAFDNKRVRSVRLPEGLCGLGVAFDDCDELEEIDLPEGIERIKAYTFSGCSALKQIVLPASVQAVEEYAFNKCAALHTLVMKNPQCKVDSKAFENCPRLADENGMRIIDGVLLAYVGEGGKVAIPETVHTIDASVFREIKDKTILRQYRDWGSLSEVTIPASVKSIGSDAFRNCKALSQVTLCEGLETIDSGAFAQCTALSSITLPKSLKSLAPDAFSACERLESILVEPGNEQYASVDGVLYSADLHTLICCPAGKRRMLFTVPEHVHAIADRAFIDCDALKKIIIPNTVKKIGRTVFVSGSRFMDIQVEMGAGSESVGADVFGFSESNGVLTYPRLPVTFLKEQSAQTRLCLGFCQSPEKYDGAYAEEYRKYAASHEKTLLKKAEQLQLKALVDYFKSASIDNEVETVAAEPPAYKPDLTVKRPSEKRKVELLEEVVCKGTLEDLEAVLNTYKPFEMMTRALGLACRYRGVDFARMLVAHGASFKYASNSPVQSKYSMVQATAAGYYHTAYYLMLVPEQLALHRKHELWGDWYEYDYTPMFGVSYMGISDELEAQRLPLEDRLEVVRYVSGQKELGVSLDEMLFWALTRGELDFADALMSMGVDLQKTPPAYYSQNMVFQWNSPYNTSSYLEIITNVSRSVYWTDYAAKMSKLQPDCALAAFERLNALAEPANKKLVMSQKLFDEMKWDDALLSFVVSKMDLAKVNQKKALEKAASMNAVSALEQMAQAGWLAQTAKLNQLIAFANDNQKTEAQAWLLDFKNRTVDLAREEAKADAKMLRQLTEDPNSASALKKLWSYKKLDDGSLIITGYKGTETEVVVPSMIGKACVTKIGEEAFAASLINTRVVNREGRNRIVSVVIPEGVTELGTRVFYGCESLEKVVLPSSLKKVSQPLARDCPRLREINLNQNVKIIADSRFNNPLFSGCDALRDKDGFIIIAGRLVGYPRANTGFFGKEEATGGITIPDGVVEICPNTFYGRTMDSITFPETLQVIGECAFENCKFLTRLDLPASLETIMERAFSGCSSIKTVTIKPGTVAIGKEAFEGCGGLRDVYIPRTVRKMGKDVFAFCGAKLCVHAQEGAPILEYLEQHNIDVLLDNQE